MKLLLISLLALTSASHADEVAHLKVAHWITHTPKIVLCNGIKIPDSVIVEAVSRWKKRGEDYEAFKEKMVKFVRASMKGWKYAFFVLASAIRPVSRSIRWKTM